MITPTTYALLVRPSGKQVDIMRLGLPDTFRWYHVATCPSQATAEILLRQLNLGAKIADKEDEETEKTYKARSKKLNKHRPIRVHSS